MPSRAWVRSDAQLLRRVLQNFLANALRYTRSGGVVCGVRRAGTHLRIEVWDSGPGIPPEQLRNVFDEFHRGSHASPWGEKGLGLGLAICDRMARLLGHRITVRSVAGRGSVFALEVARAAAQPVARPSGRIAGAEDSRVGGLQYSVADGATGFLVPPRHPQALAQRIAELQQNPVLAAALGYAGGRRARAMFTWDRVVDSLLDVYASVRRPRPGLRRSARETALAAGRALERRSAVEHAIAAKGAAQ